MNLGYPLDSAYIRLTCCNYKGVDLILKIKQKSQNIISYQIVERYLAESSGYPSLK